MRLPNFLIIGAQKAGTTSLYEYLRQHPQVYMSPVKEPHFFTYEGETPPSAEIVTEWSHYLALFSKAREGHVAIGEASPSYLHAEHAPGRIARYLPRARLIAILRNPVERAFSNWIHNVEHGREQLSFPEALAQEEERMRQGAGYAFYYKWKGFYFRHLSRYLALFPRDQLRVYLFDDLRANPSFVMRDLFEFLEVYPDVSIRFERHNVSGVPRGMAGRLFSRIRKLQAAQQIGKRLMPEAIRRRARSQLLVKPALQEEVRAYLIEVYREDVLRLQDLLRRDLSAWLR